MIIDWVWTIGAIFYLGWTLGHYVTLRDFSAGTEWVLIAMLPTFSCDTTAYFVGKNLGKHKLVPKISPKKTWEGAIGGFCAAVGVALLFSYIFRSNTPEFTLNNINAVMLGCAIGVIAQLGDLLGSKIKRISGVKDSGHLLPGHGGIIDRIGSMLFTGLIVYYYGFLTNTLTLT